MIQQAIVILAVAFAGLWLAWTAYRYLRPRNAGMCAGGCCDGLEKKQTRNSGGGVIMISSDDLRARLKSHR